MPSMTSFSVETVSICFGFFVASSLKVPALLVASSANWGKRKVSSLMTMVVCFTLSSAKDLPSSMAETKLHVPCSPSRSFLVADSSGFMTTFNKTGSRLAHELFHKIRGDATSHQRLTQEASARNYSGNRESRLPPGGIDIRVVFITMASDA